MNSTLRIAIYVIQELLIYAPDLFAKLKEIFSKQTVTVDDLEKLRKEIEETPYSKIVTGTRLTQEQQTP